MWILCKKKCLDNLWNNFQIRVDTFFCSSHRFDSKKSCNRVRKMKYSRIMQDFVRQVAFVKSGEGERNFYLCTSEENKRINKRKTKTDDRQITNFLHQLCDRYVALHAKVFGVQWQLRSNRKKSKERERSQGRLSPFGPFFLLRSRPISKRVRMHFAQQNFFSVPARTALSSTAQKNAFQFDPTVVWFTDEFSPTYAIDRAQNIEN